MKNFNFAFFFALYMIINGSVFMKTSDRNYLFISLIVTLPLLFLSLNSLIAKPESRKASPDEAFDLLQESLAPYLTALIGTSIFAVYVYRFVSDSTRQAVFFVAPRLQGWSWQDGVVIGVIGLLLGACGVGIWSAQFRQKNMITGRLTQTSAYYIFHIGRPAGIRLFIYFSGMLLLTAAGFLTVYLLFGKTAARNSDWSGYVIVSGRAVLPVVALLMAGLLRLPIIPVALLAIAGAGYLFGFNTSYTEGAVFAGTQVVILGIYAIVMSRKTRTARPCAVPVANPNVPSDSEQEFPDPNQEL